MFTKKELRRIITHKKKEYTPEELKIFSGSILAQIEQLECFIQAKNILLYYSLQDEVFTHEFISKWSKEKNIFLPTIMEENILLYYFLNKQEMQIGKYGIKEPVSIPFKDYKEIDLAIIPGVAFDLEGNRLGRGKGYYDRLLPKLNCPKIGICFSFQRLDKIPTEIHDISMDYVVSN